MQELLGFLEEANKHTYAADGKRSDSSRLQSEDLEYAKGDLLYHDTYFGGRDFIGEEIVYKKRFPVWGMNYYGFLLTNDRGENEIYNFLKEVLRQEYTDIIPVRGPKKYTKDNWLYTNTVNGELDRFSGTEEIQFEKTTVYRAWYHGGYIQ